MTSIADRMAVISKGQAVWQGLPDGSPTMTKWLHV
jgi:hypothetical protein